MGEGVKREGRHASVRVGAPRKNRVWAFIFDRNQCACAMPLVSSFVLSVTPAEQIRTAEQVPPMLASFRQLYAAWSERWLVIRWRKLNAWSRVRGRHFFLHVRPVEHRDTYPERFVKLGGVDILGRAAHTARPAGAAVHAGEVLEGVAAEEHGGGYKGWSEREK